MDCYWVGAVPNLNPCSSCQATGATQQWLILGSAEALKRLKADTNALSIIYKNIIKCIMI